MPVFNNALAGAAGSGGADAYKIERSLRFNDGDSAHLTRSFQAGNQKKWTWSSWIKRAELGASGRILRANPSGEAGIQFLSNDRIEVYHYENGSYVVQVVTERVFRDPSAWFHLVVVYDSDQATPADRLVIYINGKKETQFNTSTYPSQGYESYLNSSTSHAIFGSDLFPAGYLADVHFLDGIAISDPDGVFGEFDDTTGVWNPIEYTGDFNAAGSPDYGSTLTGTAGVGGDGVNGPFTNSVWPSSGSGYPGGSTTYAASNQQGATLTWNASSYNLSASSVVVQTLGAGVTATATYTDGSSVSATSGGSVQFYQLDLSPSGTKTLASVVTTKAGSSHGFAGVKLDGTILQLVPTGVNGFYLDFDPDAGVVYSDAVQNANNAATNLFDGSLSSYTEGSTDGTAVTWTGNVSGNTIEFYGAQNSGTRSFSVNGVDRLSLVPTTAGWFTIPNTTSLTSFSFSRGAPSGGFVDLYAIRVDGKILVDHEAPGVDASGSGNHWTANNITVNATTFSQTSVANATGGLPILNTTDTYGNSMGSGDRSDPLASNLQWAVPLGHNGSRDFYDKAITNRTSGVRHISGNPGSHSTSISNFYGGSLYMSGGASGSFSTDVWNSISAANGQFTIEFWVYLASTSQTNGYGSTIFSSRAAGDNSAGWIDIGWGGISGNKPKMRLQVSQGWDFNFNFDGSNNNAPFPSGQWIHVAVTRDGSNKVRLFGNGILLQTQTSSVGITSNSRGLFGGHAYGSFASYVNFYLQDVRIYNTCKYTSSFNPPRETTSSLNPENIDSLFDSPTNYDDGTNIGGNYCVLNPLASTGTLSNGNLTGATGATTNYGTFAIPSSGSWYWECTIGGQNHNLGIAKYVPNAAQVYLINDSCLYSAAGVKNVDGVTDVAFGGSSSPGSVIGVLANADTDTVTFYRNGTSIGSISHGVAGRFPVFGDGNVTEPASPVNFGQRPFEISSMPTGAKALCTQNLSDPAIANPSTAFDAVLYTGDGNSTKTVSGLSFSPDLIWNKARSASTHHRLFDSVRGFSKMLAADYTGAEDFVQDYGYVTATSDTGFTVGQGTHSGNLINTNTRTYVNWVWDGGDLATNSAYNQSQTWSASLSTNDTLQNPVNAFDGSTATRAQTANAGTGKTITFAPATDVSFATSLEVYCDQGNSTPTATWNGNTVNPGGGAWVTVYSGSGTINSSTPLVIDTETAGQYATLKGIRLDGKILVDPGVIPPGSANSSVYNDGEVWSTTGTLTVDLNGSTVSNMSGPLTKAFEGSLASSSMVYEGSAYTNGTKTYTYTFGTAQTNITSARVYLYQGNSAEGGAAGVGNGTVNKTQDGTYGWLDVTSTIPANGTVTAVTVTTTATSGVNSSRNGFHAIELNGKMLLDDGVTPVDNFPSIASTVRANPTAGFSIVTATQGSGNSTWGHGLNAKPDLIVMKARHATYGWYVSHSSLDNQSTKFLRLDDDTDVLTNTNWFASTEPTSSVITTKAGGMWSSNDDFLAYCWNAVKGYSAFGSYDATGSSNGPFQYTGFQVKWLMIKGSSYGSNWNIFDTSRDTDNPAIQQLRANLNSTEQSNTSGNSAILIDLLSNGFKLRAGAGSANDINQTSQSYIWAAFAENPFKIARAR